MSKEVFAPTEQDRIAFMVNVGKELRKKLHCTAEQACEYAARQWLHSSIAQDNQKARWFNSRTDEQKMYIYDLIEPTADVHGSETGRYLGAPFYSLATPEDQKRTVEAIRGVLKGNLFVSIYTEEDSRDLDVSVRYLDHSKGEPITIDNNRLWIRCDGMEYFFDWELDTIEQVWAQRNVVEIRYSRRKYIDEESWKMTRTFQVIGSLSADGQTCYNLWKGVGK